MFKNGKSAISTGLLVLTAVLALCIGAVATGCKNKGDKVSLPTPEELLPEEMPPHLNEDQLGLFFYDEDGKMASYKERVNFDPEKPTILFIHGQQYNLSGKGNEEIPDAAGWVERGYNVGEFLWSQLADDGTMQGRNKLWYPDLATYAYNDENGKRVKDAEHTAFPSLIQLFVSMYYDAMNYYKARGGYSGKEIIFTGLSLGANCLYGVCDYMNYLYEHKAVDLEFFPDRCVFFDAFLDNTDDKKAGGRVLLPDAKIYKSVAVPWTGKPIGEDGTYKIANEAVSAFKKLGVAVEYIASSMVSDLHHLFGAKKQFSEMKDETLSDLSGAEKQFSEMKDETLFLQLDTTFARFNPNDQHTAGKYWFYRAAAFPPFLDEADERGVELAPGPLMPIPYIYARMGKVYEMKNNVDEMRFDDETIRGNVAAPEIAGFAFYDANGNGTNDDRLFNRASGIKVVLFENGVEVAAADAGKSGFYSFELEPEDVGNVYKIKAYAKNIVSEKGDENDMNGNGINADGFSEDIKIEGPAQLSIVNIGLKK